MALLPFKYYDVIYDIIILRLLFSICPDNLQCAIGSAMEKCNEGKGDFMIANETLKIIQQRRSIRSYKDEPIREEELQAVVEAGLYAPNAGGQAWHFTVIQNKKLLDRLNLAAKEAAKQMDMQHLRELGNNEEFNCLYGAPVLIIVSGDEQVPIPLEADCAAATQNMLLAAESLGLGTCWIFLSYWRFTHPKAPNCEKN
jgi:hypothetical protein